MILSLEEFLRMFQIDRRAETWAMLGRLVASLKWPTRWSFYWYLDFCDPDTRETSWSPPFILSAIDDVQGGGSTLARTGSNWLHWAHSPAHYLLYWWRQRRWWWWLWWWWWPWRPWRWHWPPVFVLEHGDNMQFSSWADSLWWFIHYCHYVIFFVKIWTLIKLIHVKQLQLQSSFLWKL